MILRAGMPDPARFFFGFAPALATSGAPATFAAAALTGTSVAAVAADREPCAMTGRRRFDRWPLPRLDREIGRSGVVRVACCSPGLRPAEDRDESGSAPLGGA